MKYYVPAWRFAAAALTLLASCAAPPAEIVQSRSYDPNAEAWGAVLARCVDEAGTNYAQAGEHLELLREALGAMCGLEAVEFEQWSRKRQLAYLVNAHNAYALTRLAEAWVEDPARARTLPMRIRDKGRIRLLGRSWTLRELGKTCLGDHYGQASVIFLLNWGAAGCASLPPIPVQEHNLDRLLERQTRACLGDPDYLRFDPRRRMLRLTRLVVDHRAVFQRDYTNLWIFLGQYLPPEEAKLLEQYPPRIRPLPFDETLDSTHTPKTH